MNSRQKEGCLQLEGKWYCKYLHRLELQRKNTQNAGGQNSLVFIEGFCCSIIIRILCMEYIQHWKYVHCQKLGLEGWCGRESS